MTMAQSCLSLLLLLVVNFAGVYGSRIIGGNEVQHNSIQYQASLQLFNYHYCGGTLIHQEWVVSAAHCWLPKHLIKVVLGEHNNRKKEDTEQTFRVSRVFRHSRFNPRTFDNDIMLLQLDRKATLDDTVQLAPLPGPNTTEFNTEDTTCTVSGWGVTRVYSYRSSPVLRSVDVVLMPECKKVYKERITDNMICAGSHSGGKDSCRGDSGGPLVCNGIFEGIVSWGISCAYAHYPGVYVKVRNYLDWMPPYIKHYSKP